MSLPLISPPQPEIPSSTPPDWSGPFGQPAENARLPVAPPLDGSSFLTTVLNLLTNPSAEFDVNGFVAPTSVTLSRDRTSPVAGGYVLRSDMGSTLVSGPQTANVALTTVTLYWFSVWVRTLSGSFSSSLLALKPDTTIEASVSFTASPTWQIVTLPFVASVTGNYKMMVSANVQNVLVFLTDLWTLVAASYPVLPFDGDQPDSWWTGTPHASTSRKAIFARNNQVPADWTSPDLDDLTAT